MPMSAVHDRRAWLGKMSGLLSVLLFIVFCAAGNWLGNPAPHPARAFMIFIFGALPGVLVLSVVSALVATFTSSKWWLIVAVMGILYGTLWFGVSSF
jgi:hypothetical protein